MEKRRVGLLIGRVSVGGGYWNWKSVTSKASNRAAVHGVKPPVPDALLHEDKEEELQKEIQKAKQEKDAKRKQIEKTVESHVSNSSKQSGPSSTQ